MSRQVADAISVLSAAVSPKTPNFVKKPEFSQEVVSKTQMLCIIIKIYLSCKEFTWDAYIQSLSFYTLVLWTEQLKNFSMVEILFRYFFAVIIKQK